MENLIHALTQLVARPFGPNTRPDTPRVVNADLTSAPPAVKQLAQALAAHYYNVDLGELSMFNNGASGDVNSLEGTIEMSCERGGIDLAGVQESGGPGGGAFDPAATLELGADGGGMSYFGVTWSGGKLGLVLVEFDDPVPENLLKHFTTPAEFLAFLDDRNDGEALPDVDALRAGG